MREDAPDYVKAWVTTIPTQKARLIGQYKVDLSNQQRALNIAQAERGRIENADARRRQLQAMRQQIAETKAALKTVQRDDYLPDPPDFEKEDVKPNSFGSVPGLNVVQIIDTQNAICEIPYTKVIRTTPVRSSVGNQQPYREFGPDPLLVWVTGMPTDGLSDGQQIRQRTTIYVLSTKSYETPLAGSRTVPLITPVKVSHWIER